MLYSLACAENIKRVPNHGHPPLLLVLSITEVNLLNKEGAIRGFGNEISWILDAGYQWVGGFLVPGR
jgi:hypothetical protein